MKRCLLAGCLVIFAALSLVCGEGASTWSENGVKILPSLKFLSGVSESESEGDLAAQNIR